MAAQAGLCLAWSETPEDTFSRVVAQVYFSFEGLDIDEAMCDNMNVTTTFVLHAYFYQLSW